MDVADHCGQMAVEARPDSLPAIRSKRRRGSEVAARRRRPRCGRGSGAILVCWSLPCVCQWR